MSNASNVPSPLTIDQWENLREIFSASVKGLLTTEERRRVRVFISFCERTPGNLHIVEGLLDPFLEQLDFEVHYYKKDMKLQVPHSQINELIDMCDVIVTLYTKDQECTDSSFQPAQNVTSEVGRARDKFKLGLVEKGTHVGTLDYGEIPCIQFNRDQYGELLIDIIRSLKNTHLMTVYSGPIRK
jgi:hypothetical protein